MSIKGLFNFNLACYLQKLKFGIRFQLMSVLLFPGFFEMSDYHLSFIDLNFLFLSRKILFF